PLSVPGVRTICIFAFTLAMQEYVYALTFVSSSDEKMITLGVVTDLIRGDVFFWGCLIAGPLIVSIPVAIVYNLFMDTFVRGITGGALKYRRPTPARPAPRAPARWGAGRGVRGRGDPGANRGFRWGT